MRPLAAWRPALLSLREALVSAGPVALIALVLLTLAYAWLDPNPPARVVLATGPGQSAYDTFGQAYRRALAAHGIEVVLLPSGGSADNLRLLREGRADLGFVQGGTGAASGDQAALVSLGSLFLEPVWLFYRTEAVRRRPGGALTSLTQLPGLRVNVGEPGSGVPQLVRRLLEANGLELAELQPAPSRLEQTPATVAFLAGGLDVLAFASAPESPMVQMLLMTPGVQLMDFGQNEAYARRLPFLAPAVLPRGVVDLARNLPEGDVRLVATTTSMLAREGVHPALLQLFAQTARDLHGGAGWFHRAGSFPSLEHAEVPVSPEAQRAIRAGQPFLQRWLPFWMANLVERMWLALGLIIAVLLPLSRIVPPLYEFRIRSRVFRWYGQLREIETRLQEGASEPGELLRDIDALDAKVGRIAVPLAYVDELYALRNNIAGVRQRVAARAA